MEFLRRQLFDEKNLICPLLIDDGLLRNPDEQHQLSEEIRKEIFLQFIDGLARYSSYLPPEFEYNLQDLPLTLSSPSWTGYLSPEKNNKVMVIGPTPIVTKDYFQCSYNFHSEAQSWDHFNRANATLLFRYVAELLGEIYDATPEVMLGQAYFTHVFPIGSRFLKEIRRQPDGLIKEIVTPWSQIRAAYARDHLQNEIQAVNPKLILVLGREAFFEVKDALSLAGALEFLKVGQPGIKQERIRAIKWKNINIVGIPHIGSNRNRKFWRRNVEEIGKTVAYQLSLDENWRPYY